MFQDRRMSKRLILLLFFLMMMGLVLILNIKFKEGIIKLSKSQVQLEGSKQISKIVEEQIIANIKYEDIVIIHKDDQGKIVLLQPNTVVINSIMAKTVGAVSQALLAMKDQSIGVPIGQLTGSTLLAAAGPKINVRIIPSSQVEVNLVNRFEQAGINQTRHLLYLNMDTKITVAVPYINDEVRINTTVPLAETIIIGQVPENYINFRSLDSEIRRIGE